MAKLFIVTGEQSGDAHGADLVRILKQRNKPIDFYGVVGPALRAEGVQEVARAEDLSVMGFTDVIKVLPRLLRVFTKVRDSILQLNPEAVLMVDATSFNLRLAKSLRKRGYKGKLIQYVSPSVWAWGRKRVQHMAKTLDLLMTIYPFEKQYFASTDLRVEYVGNPVLAKTEKYIPNQSWKKQVGIPENEKLIALFPGSREDEIHRNLPIMLQAVSNLPKGDLSICVSSSNPAFDSIIAGYLQNSTAQSYVVPHVIAHQELMSSSVAALAKSGTVTLELALQQCPTIVSYQLTALNRFVARYILKVNLPHYCIVNILAGETVFPEYIVHKPTPENLSQSLNNLINNRHEREKCLEGCRKVRQLLSTDDLLNERCASLVSEEIP